jgi:hypothetical protein
LLPLLTLDGSVETLPLNILIRNKVHISWVLKKLENKANFLAVTKCLPSPQLRQVHAVARPLRINVLPGKHIYWWPDCPAVPILQHRNLTQTVSSHLGLNFSALKGEWVRLNITPGFIELPPRFANVFSVPVCNGRRPIFLLNNFFGLRKHPVQM